MKPNVRRVWVIEMWNSETDQWEPTADGIVGLSRNEGRVMVEAGRADCPDDKFRLRPYTPQEQDALQIHYSNAGSNLNG